MKIRFEIEVEFGKDEQKEFEDVDSFIEEMIKLGLRPDKRAKDKKRLKLLENVKEPPPYKHAPRRPLTDKNKMAILKFTKDDKDYIKYTNKMKKKHLVYFLHSIKI